MHDIDVRRYEAQLRNLLDAWARRVRGAEDGVLTPSGDSHADRGDEAVEAAAVDQALEALAVVETERDAVHAALERIAAGTFGLCAKCGQSIARARLDFVPYAPECAACAEARLRPNPPRAARSET